MRTSRTSLAVAALSAGVFSGCTGDLPTQAGAHDPPEAPPVSLEIVSVNELGAVMRVQEQGADPVFLTLRDPGAPAGQAESISGPTIGDESGPQAALLPALILALKVWSVVETIRVCAPPIYQDLRRTNSISQRTATDCATQAAINVSSGILAKIASPVIKVTVLRNSIKSMVGNVVTHRQLQKLINKQNKANINALIQEMTKIFYAELMSGYAKVFNSNGIR